MTMPQILLYAAAGFCLLAVVARAVRYARQPVHLRWELYPVAHEQNRAAHGGSRFEQFEHWRRPRRVDRVGEVRAMAAEVLLLAGVRRHNRALWVHSLPFHAGVYLVVTWLALLLAAGSFWPAGDPPALLAAAIALAGFCGLALGIWGAVGLLGHRLRNPALRAYNAPADLFNLAIWLAYLGWTLAVHAAAGGFASLVPIAGAWLRLQPIATGWAPQVEMILGAALLAYLPLSRMFHFVAKYFLYHEVRWEDAPNVPGGALERRLARAMAFGVGWSAAHASDARSWSDAAAADREAGS